MASPMSSASHRLRAASTMPSSKTASISISGEGGFAAQGQGVGGIGIDDAVDAGDQALQGGFVDPIGAAEAVHHPHLVTLGGGVPDILGEGVVGDGGAVEVPPLGDAQIHT